MGLDARLLAALAYRAPQEARHPWGTVAALSRPDSSDKPKLFNPQQAEAMGQTLNALKGRTGVTGGGAFSAERIGFQPPAEARLWTQDQERRIMGGGGRSAAHVPSGG